MNMAIRLLTTLGLLIGLTAISQAQEEKLNFKLHTDKGGQFAILFPGAPKKQEQDTDSPLGKLTVHTLMVEPNPKIAFLVSYNDYPAIIKDDEPQDVLGRVRDGNNQFLKGKLVVDRKISLGKEKHAGREIEFVFPFMGMDMTYRANIFLVDSRLFQIVMIGSKEETHTEAADDYFRSFKLAGVIKNKEKID